MMCLSTARHWPGGSGLPSPITQNEPTPEMSPGAPLFGEMMKLINAEGIGASPLSRTPSDSNVSDGRCGSNGPIVGLVKSCHTRENAPISYGVNTGAVTKMPGGRIGTQLSTVSRNVVVLCTGHSD